LSPIFFSPVTGHEVAARQGKILSRRLAICKKNYLCRRRKIRKIMALKFFNLPKAKQFHIPYRYYDPIKEEREERERRVRDELGLRVEGEDPGLYYRANIKGQFRRAMKSASRTSSDARRKSNTRLLFLIMILALLAYLVFYR